MESVNKVELIAPPFGPGRMRATLISIFQSIEIRLFCGLHMFWPATNKWEQYIVGGRRAVLDRIGILHILQNLNAVGIGYFDK